MPRKGVPTKAKAKKPQVPGLYLRDDGIYEKYFTHKVSGKRIPCRSADPAEVWRKYYSHEEGRQRGPLFSDFAETWYQENVQHWRQGTIKTYKPALARIKDYFHDTRLKEIDAADINSFLLWLKDKGFYQKTVANHLSIINMVLLHSITCTDRWRKDNPAQFVRLPHNLKKKKRTPPTDEQMDAVRAGLGNKYGLLAAVFLYTGIRLGEALALQGKKIGEKLTIDQEIVFYGNTPILEPYVKTDAGMREVGYLYPLKELLPTNLGEDDFLFGGTSPWTKSAFSKRWISWCRSIGLAHQETRTNAKGVEVTEWKAEITPHQLRHEYATLCYEAEVDEKVAARMFGHADPITMRRIYQSIRASQVDTAIQRMDIIEREKRGE